MGRQRELLAGLVEATADRGGPDALDTPYADDWRAATDDAGRRRAVIDQVASLTDASAVAWHDRLGLIGASQRQVALAGTGCPGGRCCRGRAARAARRRADDPNGECAAAADAALDGGAGDLVGDDRRLLLAVSATVDAADCTRGSSFTLKARFLICS